MSERPETASAEPADRTATDGPRFRLLLVPGVVPASWIRTWRERVADVPLELVHATAADAGSVLARGEADAALLRLPVDRDVLSAIPLYVETTVVVLPKDHLLTALDEVGPDDLAEETVLTPADDVLRWPDAPGEPSLLPQPATTEEAVALVASGVGLLLVPQSLARLHHRKDLTYRPLTGAPGSQAALAWLADRDGDPLVEELIGIVRGRTVNSSRGRGATAPADAAPTGKDARAGRTGGAGRGGAGKTAAAKGAGGRSGGTPARGGRPSSGSGGGRGRSGGRPGSSRGRKGR
ncbi:LysR family substrate-binding domain-containing protein [Cellulomonas sp. IC4_254]|uniref:LysR family substrate-binding domain-containing protein n=1 Tax=Cellulomonas sp. IC4_254 TaxID=2714040 RepID=UPI00142219F7|nr:LysR family substrate-binding domain-containing protein [Cellulomonas sp. IC4_254]NHT16415.1 LysR family substrate-binding domain-containing protein [Cellulomonas sp. IC4_254]